MSSSSLAPIYRQTGLVLNLPELEEILSPWRDEFDPLARIGLPPHITVLTPFMDSAAMTEADHSRLTQLCAEFSPIEMRFETAGTFKDAAWLSPRSSEMDALFAAVQKSWPKYPSYNMPDREVIPHLTVANGIRPNVAHEVASSIIPILPIRTKVSSLTLLALEDSSWQKIRDYAFSQPTSSAD